MSGATHATITTLRRDLSKAEMQRQAFETMFAHGFDDVPGFVSGLWTFDPEAGDFVIVHSFDSRDAAATFASMAEENARRQAALGLELVSVRLNEVLGSA
jgi:hypothetical protein